MLTILFIALALFTFIGLFIIWTHTTFLNLSLKMWFAGLAVFGLVVLLKGVV